MGGFIVVGVMVVKAPQGSKAWAENFFLLYAGVWISIFGSVVITKAYEDWGDLGYMTLGLVLALPYVLIPLFFPGPVDRNLALTERYWVKANIWVAIFSYVGNYFYTHYFYKVLGAAYSFPVAIQLNEVPFFLYLITHAYFMGYFSFSNMLIRFLRTRRFYLRSSRTGRIVSNSILIFLMSVFTAFMETFTIQSVPYYTHESKEFMYTVGSVFYGWYFYVAFPMFFEVDEKPGRAWTIWQTAVNSLAACMIVLIFLDLTRLVFMAWGVSPVCTTPFL